MRLRYVVAALTAIPAVALAQPITNNLPVYQSGTVTPGHVPIFSTGGVIVDNGASDNGGATGFGMTAPGLDLFVNDNPITSLSGYHQLGFGALATIGGNTGGFITYNAYGGATPQSLYINLNGVNYEVPFTGTGLGNVTGPTSSTSDDFALFNNSVGSLLKDGGVVGAISHLNVGGGLTSDATTLDLSPTVSATPATATGSPNSMTITPSYTLTGLSTVANGLAFKLTSPFTNDFTGFAAVSSIVGLTGGPWNIFYTDGKTRVYSNDLVTGQLITLMYSSTAGGFILNSTSPVVSGFITGNGINNEYTIAAGSTPPSSTINLNAASGGNDTELFYNPDNGSYRAIRLTCCKSQNVFNNTAIVNGVANSSLTCNHPYIITTEPVGGQFNALPGISSTPYSFWDGTLGYTSTGSSDGLNVLDRPGTGIDVQRLVLGFVYPRIINGACDVGNSISTNGFEPMGNAVYSYAFAGRENFGYSDTKSNGVSTVFATAAGPHEGTMTAGINDTPNVVVNTYFQCPTAGTNVAQQIQFKGETLAGTVIPVTLWDTEWSTVPTANGLAFVSSQYASAPATEWIEFQVQFIASTGGCNATTHMTGMFPQ